jgi:hypothetical protein
MINNIPFFANLKLANINDSMYSEGLSILNNTTPDLLRECSLANELDGVSIVPFFCLLSLTFVL